MQQDTIKGTKAINAMLQFLQLVGVPTAVQTAALAADCLEDAEAGFTKHNAFFEQHDIDEPYDNLHEAVLYIALQEHGLIKSVDWKEAPEEVLAWIADLLAPVERAALTEYGETVSEDVYPDVVLGTCSEILHQQFGKRLLLWDTGGDEYAFFILPSKDVTQCIELAKSFGVHVDVSLPEGEEDTPDTSFAASSEKVTEEPISEDAEESKGNGKIGCVILVVILGAVGYGAYSLAVFAWSFISSYLKLG